MSRKVTKRSIIPVLRFIEGWDKDIHSLNTPGAKYYHFTLDKYNGKNSFTGGFATDISDCYNYNGVPYDEYVIDMNTKEVTKLHQCNTVDLLAQFTTTGVCGTCARRNHKKATR